MVQFTRQQTTIIHPVTVSGFGFWSGQDVTVQFHPAAANTGVVFVRIDQPGHPRIPARVEFRQPGPRRTTLCHNGHAVEMVEHVLSAVAGLRIDNVEIHVDRAEMPGVDGSSLPFVSALRTAGVQPLESVRETIEVAESFTVGDAQSRIEVEPSTSGQFELCFELDYPNCPAIGSQRFATVLTPGTYSDQIAAARTFVLESEADQLRRQGLGGRVNFQDILVFNQHGPIDNPLRFADECARHKVLDMVGDFALAGADIVGKFTAYKTGHRLNAEVAMELLRRSGSETYKNRLTA